MVLRDKILNNNPIMRISLAFLDFVRNNQDFDNRVENVIMYKYKGLSDYDFEYDHKLYSFFYQYIDKNNIRCCVKEYDKFYDNIEKYNYLLFDYSLLKKDITKVIKTDTKYTK